MMNWFDLVPERNGILDSFKVLAVASLVFAVGCASTAVVDPGSIPKDRNADRLLIVDCLLPGQVRRLGRSITYLTPRRPVKVPTSECEIRGGEYVAYDRANFSTSLKIWLPNAKKGDPEAQTYVGEIFEKGLGLPADPAVAASWYQKAADQGYERAMVNLGYLYESGIGVPKDLVKAMNFYRAAAGFDDGSLEYVTPLEVATRKQQAQDLVRQEEDINRLNQQVADLEQKNAELQRKRRQLQNKQQETNALKAEVERQRQLVLEQSQANAANNSERDATNAQLTDTLAELESLNEKLASSESGKADLVQQLRRQQEETDRLRTAFNATNRDLNEAKENLRDQERKLAVIRTNAAADSQEPDADDVALLQQNRAQSDKILELETRLSSAQQAFDLQASKTDDLQRALAQKTSALQDQIASAEAREKILQDELGRLSGDLADSEISGTQLRNQLTQQLKNQQQQVEQIRRQLNNSARELRLTQSRLEAAQAEIAESANDDAVDRDELTSQRQQFEDKIFELENRIALARTKELDYQGELDRLSSTLMETNLDAATLKSDLNSRISQQRNEINSLRAELTASSGALQSTQAQLETAQSAIAQKSPELTEVRQKLIRQKAVFQKQISSALEQEEALKLELQRLGSIVADEQLDKAQLKNRFDEQLQRQRQQTQALLAELETSNRELGEAKSQLTSTALRYSGQSTKLQALQNQLGQQQAALKAQIDTTAQRERQLQAELERTSERAADAEVQNALLSREINSQKQLIASLRTQYEESSRELAATDNDLGSQQNRIAQLQRDLQQVRNDANAALQREKGISAKYKQELEEAQAVYASLNAEVEQLRSRQSSTSRDLEQQLETASRSEDELKKRLEVTTQSAENLQRQLATQEKQYRAQLARAESELATVKDDLSRVQDDSIDAQLKLAGLESELQSQQTLLSSQEAQINELQSEVTKAQAAANKPQSEQVQLLVDAGPAIQIIEPEITITRGSDSLQVAARGTQTIDLIGRVRPADDLLSFKINNDNVELNSNGVFKYATPNNSKKIKLLAINNEGERTDLELSLVQKRSATPAAQQDQFNLDGIKFGNFHALVIGNNNFEYLQNLKTAENDAIAVETLLREKFGFKTKLLLNANRYDTLNALNELRKELTEEDNLIIYYAGHGELANETGYWMPVDAEPDSDVNWISNQTITKYIETINAKHIMVVADSCYSGTLSRASLSQISTGLTDAQKRKWFELNNKARVRTVLTSGGVKPVLDSVGDSQHSVFSAAFLDELETLDQPVISAYKLFLKVQQRVKSDADRLGVDQNPQYAAMQYAGHESGEFLFVQSSATLTGSVDIDTFTSDPDLRVAQQ